MGEFKPKYIKQANVYNLKNQEIKIANMNNTMMTNLQLFKTLVRLAQIAEEVEEENPQAADEIDSFSQDVTQGFGDNKPQIDPTMFPAVTTPSAFTPSEGGSDEMDMNQEESDIDKNALEQKITDEILRSKEFQDIEPIFDTPEGQEAMQNLINRKIEEALKGGV